MKDVLLADAREVVPLGEADGLECLEASGPDLPAGIGVVLTDPRVHGGTFSAESLAVLRGFLQRQAGGDRPLVMALATGGVRITQPRTIFQDVFGSVADLFALRKRHLLITVAAGKTLGIGAMYFGQGHLRIAGGEESLINLTGPGVMDGYFGQGAQEFRHFASAGHQFVTNRLVQHVAASPADALAHVRALLGFVQAGAPAWPANCDVATENLLRDMADDALEVFPGRARRWRTFLCRTQGKLFGLITHPPRNPDNLLGVAEVQRALDAVQLFKALRVPLVSGIDSPGGDPRQAVSDADMVLRSLELAEALVDYPFPKLGLLLARCYGGIGLFTLPRDHGSRGLFALEGARIGIVSDAIIDKLVPPGAKLRPEWEATRALHSADMSEMLASGNVQAFWPRAALRARLVEALWGVT